MTPEYINEQAELATMIYNNLRTIYGINLGGDKATTLKAISSVVRPIVEEREQARSDYLASEQKLTEANRVLSALHSNLGGVVLISDPMLNSMLKNVVKASR